MAAPHSTDPTALQAEKRALRQTMLAARQAGRDTAPLIASMLSCIDFAQSDAIAGVWPLAGEPDLRPLWHELHRRGHRLLLPETTRIGDALEFRPWQPGTPMVRGRFATLHPASGRAPADAAPDLLFVPLLAFDRFGFRLGYGGGYYDRTLAALPRAHAIGYGFSDQQVERVPRGAFDLALSAIVTEAGPVALER